MGTHSRWVTGLAATRQQLADLLAGWRRPDDPPDDRLTWTSPSGWHAASVNPGEALWRLPEPDPDEELGDLVHTDGAELDALELRLHDLRAAWADRDLTAILTKRAKNLERTDPQHQVDLTEFIFWDDDDPNTDAVADGYGWIDPRAVRLTPDPHWGTFKRTGPRRQNVEPIVTSLLTTPAAQTRALLVDRFLQASGVSDLIHLHRFPGPAGGALFELGASGSHRVHTARLLELPWLFARQEYRLPPTRIGLNLSGHRAGLLGYWRGLRDRDVIAARVAKGVWELTDLQRLPAWWLLGPPERACTANRAYERLHPGALTATGIPAKAAARPRAWRRWLLGSAWQRWTRTARDLLEELREWYYRPPSA